jgi:Nickel responsive protein SCO4226-like
MFPVAPQRGEPTMPKFMSCHTLPAGAMKREQVDQMAAAAQCDPVVKPYRSFLNLAEGKACCVMEAPDMQALAAWFARMQMPCDYIMPVELEGERGAVQVA